MSSMWSIRAFNSGRELALGCMAMVGLLVAPSAAAAGQSQSQVTFTKDVAPILQRSCQACHRPGSIAPMSLLTYEEVRPWARAIKDRVARRSMPPWFIDRTVGIQKFKEDRSLSDQEIATIVKWADSGAKGNPADMPPPRTFDTNVYQWTIGQPDLIIPIPEPWVVAADAPNQWVDLISDSGLTEDRYIKAIETKPSLEGFKVVHHASTYLLLEDGAEEALGEYALGKTGDIFPDGTGRLIKAGTKIKFNMHYASNGERTTDRTSVGFTLYPKGYVPKHKLIRRAVGTITDLDIPAGESNVRHDGYTVMAANVRLTVVQPHMHNRGKRQCVEAIYTDGRVQPLNCINWDFGWHIAYNYADDVQPLLPKGTMLHVISWHDNSTANKWNPDPKNWIGWGDRSSDDMAFTHLSYYELSDEEFAAEVKVRRAAATN